MFKDIVWSSNYCTLKTFVDSYHLPQLVQVESGWYSEDEAKTLSTAQILTLHYTKQTDKVLAKAAEKRPFLIPVNFPCKVEILPTICEDRYYSVSDVVNASSVKFIRVVHDSPPWLGLKAGDILELKKTVEQNREKFIECEFHDKTRDLVRLPLEFKAAFEPLAKVGEYHFQEVLNTFKLPIRVKFTSSNTMIQDVNHDIDLLSFDSVLLKEFHEESTIIATSRADNAVTVVMIPSDLDVSVYPAEGAITGDKTYARFCKEIHDGADLEKVELSLASVVRLGDEPDVEVLYDYEEIKPPVPPRGSVSSQAESDDDSHDDYVEIPLPPPRPLKKSNLQTPPLSVHSRDYRDDDDDSNTEYLYPEEYEVNKLHPIHAKTPPPISPKPKHSLKQDRGPPLPVRNESLPQRYLATGRHDASTSCYVQSNRNPHGQKPILSDQTTEPKIKSIDIDGALEKDEDFDNGGDDNDDDVSDADSWDSDDSHDYIYPEYPAPSYVNSEITSSAPQAQPNQSSSNKSPLKKKIFSLPVRFKRNKEGREPIHSDKSPISSSYMASSSLDLPDDLKCLSLTGVGHCLKKLNLENHVNKFANSQIDGELFLTLDKEKLSSLGVTNAFEQTKIMKFINGWRPNTN